MITARERYIGVEVDPEARRWLEHVRTNAPRRLERLVLVDVWLTRSDDQYLLEIRAPQAQSADTVD